MITDNTKLSKTENAVSATKLQTARTINGIAFDGTQNINIEAPLTYRGNANTADQLDNAKETGFYLVNSNPYMRTQLNLYDYGFLYVYKQDGIIHQIYYAHVTNESGSIAMRQTWNGNWQTSNTAWRIIDAPLNNTLTSISTTQALTAHQGKILNEIKANINHTHSTQHLTDFNIRHLSATENLNDITIAGFYTQLLNSNTSIDKNYPENLAGTLLVMPSAYDWQQEYTVYSNGHKYVRNRTAQNTNSWTEWFRIDGADWLKVRNKPSTLVHTTGANFTGGISTPDLTTIRLRSTEALALMTQTQNNAQRLYTGGLLASDNYSDSSSIPINGIYAKGQIKTGAGFLGNLIGNADTATKLQTPRQIALTGAVTGSVNFDGSGNVNLSTVLSDVAKNEIGLGAFVKAETGYTKLPNGFILQWGVTSSIFDERNETITFPIAFPNAVLGVQLTEKEKTTRHANATHLVASNVTRTNFEFWINSTLSISTSAYWLAIGY